MQEQSAGAEALMHHLKLSHNNRIFFPKSSIALENVEQFLAQRNIECYAASAYRVTSSTPDLSFLHDTRVHVLCFLSPSAVISFHRALYQQEFAPAVLDNIITACIGETTAACARVHGFHRIVIAQLPTLESLIDTLRIELSFACN